ncbi:hypothetical protein [Chryseobacterium nepalense]|jgi:hypothetical protein|uniref:Uncharacterized protein n=1 Tax=Chryseobacterium nepalense TaxID=1854498 RepID=A0ABY4K6K4_9FLAO|nr:hypothetical protein [Chryseobacterium nepalense]UPQ75840.1 hypothetical protein M0D58_17570 [Chryseobacterium nepalense]
MKITAKKEQDGLILAKELEQGNEIYSAILWISNASSLKLMFGVEEHTDDIVRQFKESVEDIIVKNNLSIDLDEVEIKRSDDDTFKLIRSLISTSSGYSSISLSGNFVNGIRTPDCFVYRLL